MLQKWHRRDGLRAAGCRGTEHGCAANKTIAAGRAPRQHHLSHGTGGVMESLVRSGVKLALIAAGLFAQDLAPEYRSFRPALLAAPAAAEDGFRPLFNGKDLEGWIEDTPGVWSARDGMIVGKTQGLKHNDFLRARKHYKDFTLKLRFRLVNGTGNSGIQFRSRPVEGSHEVSGYQADIGEAYWGCLYDESRRRRVLAQASPASLAGLRKDAWNEYVITARGNHITLDLNGVRTVDYQEQEPGMDVAGLIALQVHGGPPLEVQFRDIRIREH